MHERLSPQPGDSLQGCDEPRQLHGRVPAQTTVGGYCTVRHGHDSGLVDLEQDRSCRDTSAKLLHQHCSPLGQRLGEFGDRAAVREERLAAGPGDGGGEAPGTGDGHLECAAEALQQLLGVVEIASPRGGGTTLVAPGVIALAVMSTAFTGQAILMGFERRWGVLRLLGTTPLGRSGLLTAKALSVLVVLAIQLVVLGATGLALGWRPSLLGLLPALLAVVLGTAAFATLAACLGGSLRAEAVLGLANLVWVLLAAGGGVLIPATALPGALATVVAQ